MPSKSNNYLKVKLTGNVKETFDILLKRLSITESQLIFRAIEAYSAYIKFVGLKSAAIKRFNEMKQIYKDAKEPAKLHAIKQAEETLETLMKAMARDVMDVYNSLIITLETPEFLSDEYIEIIEAALGTDELEVNFSNPKFREEFNEWKQDKTSKGLEELIAKYKKEKVAV